jgi:hypothetical protein
VVWVVKHISLSTAANLWNRSNFGYVIDKNLLRKANLCDKYTNLCH